MAGGTSFYFAYAINQLPKDVSFSLITAMDPTEKEPVEKMREADGIILASPTYFADVSAEMKALIDRTGMLTRSGGDFLRYKVGAAVISARRAGSTHAFDTINHLFLASQMIVPGSSYWNMGLGRLEGEVSEDEEGMDCMETLGMNMAWLLHRITE